VYGLPIIRKVIQVGNSRAISLPKSWLDLLERETGESVNEVKMEVDNVITISPILPKKVSPILPEKDREEKT
jgi:antitoxin component of MazEF toxin-antitoxin module